MMVDKSKINYIYESLMSESPDQTLLVLVIYLIKKE